MSWFQNPGNITNPIEWIQWTNNVTAITDISGNPVMSGFFGLGLLIIVGFGFFIGFKTYYSTERAFMGSLFITTTASYLMWVMEIVPFNIVAGLTLTLAISIFLLFIGEKFR